MKKVLSLLLLLAYANSLAVAETVYLYKQNVEASSSEIDMNTFKPANQSNIRNTFGKNQDYITAPSNVDFSMDIKSILTKINDPYVIKINRTKYYLVKNSENGVYTLDNIVGYGDKKTSLFTSLKSLNSDEDSTKLTKEELQKAGVRFVAVNFGKLQLNDPSKDFEDLFYIDLSNTRESVNNGIIGSFGYFDVYIKDKNGMPKKIIGYVSFDNDNELLEMIK